MQNLPMEKANPAHDWAMIDRALATAALAHRQQTRKSTAIPYIVHPCAVGFLLLAAGCPTEVVVAGILHDVIEDTPVTLEALRREFGGTIADLVALCSEPDKSLPWERRKQHTIRFLATAPPAVKLVVAADKLHNLRSIALERHRVGEAVWQRFNRGRAQQEWYYRSVAESLMQNLPEGCDTSLFEQLQQEVAAVFG
ncbi:MAG: HD domain-containing protein [candidate division KSB1 bacterium]|nr:HD domain-containing protein [candidate division KSB1 bacterium]MDZ7273823.1 HD domain-containing protein [candidate division KSB1 bacterium]MDZ7285979.1 HD domain-containing protein [candidate division KSB1 bacterium]MDZ7299011.1 HD domain-containing protein [candidate division KSB1 bacterium]MDZ7307980.1 HD domain-containing protein [candidate division KSB1 bacterium]